MIPTLLLCVDINNCFTSCLGVGDYIVTMDKTIIGRIGEKAIHETILNYQSKIPEQELTAKKNIRNKFAVQGYDPNEVSFD